MTARLRGARGARKRSTHSPLRAWTICTASLEATFVANCLETLEEIGIRAREQFKAAGGEELALVPSLNATPRWIEAVVEMLHEAQPVLAAAVMAAR